ncbi:MAG: glycoside hydrolase family 38 C-terminal domain-containing protein [Acutalibacteraceae bacterium]|nr:glycoside hydrolase family 38 C-terminal domain-containing protein [Acutalibacteraceae bacterium]
MHTLNPRVLHNQIKQIEPYAVTDRLVIGRWRSYTGMHVSPNNIVLDDKPPVTLGLGDRWNVGYDETRYFEAEITVPSNFEGKKVYLSIDFGGEALVRINGEIVGAVSSRENSGWVHRTEILFKDGVKTGEKLSIQIEGTVDCAGFCNNAMAGEKYMEYRMKKAELIAVDKLTESYWYDISTAWDAYENCEDQYVKSRLFNAMDDSVHQLDFDLGGEAFIASVPNAVNVLWGEIEKIEYSTPGEVIMAGHSHLDVAWLWTVREITRKTARTFANNLALMDNYPDFKFTQSQAVLYDFMKKHYPDIFERVKEKVKNGQWEIVGNAWVEADTNIASGEALVRQLLYGREFFMKEFGVSSDIYWLPDCFGFTWALPQIIKRSGMKYFMTSKLFYNDTNEFPHSVFRWRSHSGDEILAYLCKQPYQSEYNAEYVTSLRKNNRQNSIVDVSCGMFGYGDGGGGCTYKQVETGKRIEKLPGMPKTTNGKVADFFKAIDGDFDKLPVYDGELYYENHRGTFTSQAFIKKNNRRGEFMMRNAEILNVFGGEEYPAEKMEEAWKILLINQFHDILPGTSIHEAMENTREEYAQLRQLGGELVRKGKDGILNKVSVKDDSVLVWNMLTWQTKGIVKAEIPHMAKGIKNSDGKLLTSKVYEENGKYYIEFLADPVPAFGYGVFTLCDGTAEFENVKVTKNTLENKYLKVSLDGNGLIDEVIDKTTGRQILTGKGNLMTISHDKPIYESAWNMEFDYQMKFWELRDAESIEVVEASPLRGAVRVVRKFHESTITQDIILEKDKPTLDFDTTVDWHEREKVLKAEFPVDIRNRNASCEIAHGAAEYPTHYNTCYDQAKFEFCAHKWADLSEGGYGASIINDCKYGYNVHDNMMKITLLRGPICPDPMGDLGMHHFRYSFYPHAGTWRDADTVRLGFEENVRLEGEFIGGTGGNDLGHTYAKLDGESVILDAVKPAQDGRGYIVRMYESETRHCTVKASFELEYSKVIECNLMECDEQEIDCENGEFTFKMKPHEVKTFRLV